MKKIFNTGFLLNKIMLASMFFLTLMSISPFTNAKGIWGTRPLLEKYRPQRNWINRFSKTADVIANNSISDAIESCDEIVGEGKYCVVEIGKSTKGLPLELFRSRTKLIGKPDMRALRSSQNGIFIYIGDETQQVIIEGLNIQGHHAGENEIFAIIVEGESIQKILIRNNIIHDFSSDRDAHGIAVFGTGNKYRTGIRNVIIEGNEVYSMRTGSSESIVINGK